MTLAPHQRLADGAVERIIAAVGGAPPDLDREELQSDLEGIASLYRTGVDFRQAPAKREQNAVKIAAVAEHLKSLIEGELRLRRHCLALDRLIADVKDEFPPRLVKMLGAGRVSAFDNLVGGWLRDAFERHFKMKAGYQRSDGSFDGRPEGVEGPFIDFVEAFLKAAGITNNKGKPYSRNTIANAL